MATLKDLLDSGMSREEINAMLSQSTVGTDSFQGQPSPDFRDARDLGAVSTGGGLPSQQQTMEQFFAKEQPEQPEQQPQTMAQFFANPQPEQPKEQPTPLPQNYVKMGNNAPIDLGQSRRTHDVYRDGPQVLQEFQNPDGTIERFVKKPTTDGFGRQSTVVVRETVTPDYMNPAKLKELEFQKKRAEIANMTAKQVDTGSWDTVESNGKQYLINKKTGQIKPAEIGGEQLKGKKSDAVSKRESQMEGLGDAISQAKAILEGSAPDQKALPTGSGVGSMWDALSAQVGATPSGATEAQRMKVLGGALTSKMPRMEGPQSDKDTQLYKEMAGLVGDDTVPIPRRLDALDQVSKLWLKYEKPKSVATAYDAEKESRYQEWKKARGM